MNWYSLRPATVQRLMSLAHDVRVPMLCLMFFGVSTTFTKLTDTMVAITEGRALAAVGNAALAVVGVAATVLWVGVWRRARAIVAEIKAAQS